MAMSLIDIWALAHSYLLNTEKYSGIKVVDVSNLWQAKDCERICRSNTT